MDVLFMVAFALGPVLLGSLAVLSLFGGRQDQPRAYTAMLAITILAFLLILAYNQIANALPSENLTRSGAERVEEAFLTSLFCLFAGSLFAAIMLITGGWIMKKRYSVGFAVCLLGTLGSCGLLAYICTVPLL